jgi:amidase
VQIDRRQLLAASTALALPVPVRAADAPGDAIGTAAHIRSGASSARAEVEGALARLEAAQARLNLATVIDKAGALARLPADPKAVAVPTLIKDLNDLKGLPTRNGSRAFAAVPPAAQNDRFVEGLLGTNLLPIGKSTTPEFGLMCTTEPLAGGPTRNPWNPDLSPGGSSGGSAAAVASGVVPMAHANDGGGSIRIPAALCGLFGFKPSRGRVAGQKKADDPAEIAIDNVVSRSVRDSALIVASLSGTGAEGLGPMPHVQAPLADKLTVGVLTATANGTRPDANVAAAIAGARALLERLGHRVVEVAWPFDAASFARDFTDFWALGAAQAAAGVKSQLGAEAAARLEPLTLHLAARGAAIPQADAKALIGRLAAYRTAYDASFKGHDVLMTPVLTRHAIPLGLLNPAGDPVRVMAEMMDIVAYTPVQNVCGAPAMSVPLHWTASGLPVGVHFAGRRGDDARLLALALQLETAQPWAHRRPPIWFGN